MTLLMHQKLNYWKKRIVNSRIRNDGFHWLQPHTFKIIHLRLYNKTNTFNYLSICQWLTYNENVISKFWWLVGIVVLLNWNKSWCFLCMHHLVGLYINLQFTKRVIVLSSSYMPQLSLNASSVMLNRVSFPLLFLKPKDRYIHITVFYSIHCVFYFYFEIFTHLLQT